MRIGFVAIIALLLMSTGCFSVYRFAPKSNDDSYSYRGYTIYYRTGKVADEYELKEISRIINEAEETVAKCFPDGESFVIELPKYPLIILPQERFYIFGEDIGGFTDLTIVFLKRGEFYRRALAHEWMHIYLYYSGRKFLGDIFHSDVLWDKCEVR